MNNFFKIIHVILGIIIAFDITFIFSVICLATLMYFGWYNIITVMAITFCSCVLGYKIGSWWNQKIWY